VEEAITRRVADTETDTVAETQQVPRIAASGGAPVADTATATAMEAGAGVPPLAREERYVTDTETATETDTQGDPPVSARKAPL
jgi:hypothetical protein